MEMTWYIVSLTIISAIHAKNVENPLVYCIPIGHGIHSAKGRTRAIILIWFMFFVVICFCLGGSGQRKLAQVLMDGKGGYTGKLLRKASNNGKITLFLIPLQEDLDTSPLPLNAPEFAGMPQVPCLNCGTTMPLQMLQLHTDLCKPAPKVICVLICHDWIMTECRINWFLCCIICTKSTIMS